MTNQVAIQFSTPGVIFAEDSPEPLAHKLTIDAIERYNETKAIQAHAYDAYGKAETIFERLPEADSKPLGRTWEGFTDMAQFALGDAETHLVRTLLMWGPHGLATHDVQKELHASRGYRHGGGFTWRSETPTRTSWTTARIPAATRSCNWP